MNRASQAIAYLDGENRSNGIVYDHKSSSTIMYSGEMYCPAGVATNFLSYPLQLTLGKGLYCFCQIYGVGIAGNELCNFNPGVVFHIDKNGNSVATNIYTQGNGKSGGLASAVISMSTTSAVVTNGIITSLPRGNVAITPSANLWVSFDAEIMFCSEI